MINNIFYNATISANKITYQPFMYDQSDCYNNIVAGAAISIIGIALTVTNIFSDGYILGLLPGLLLMANGLYRMLITNKATLVFDKATDTVYLQKNKRQKKLISISNIYGIQTNEQNRSYGYELANRINAAAKGISISSFFTIKSLCKQEVIYFETELLPSIRTFLNVDAELITPHVQHSMQNYLPI